MGSPGWSNRLRPGTNGLYGRRARGGRSRADCRKKKNAPRYLGVDQDGKVTLVSGPEDGAYWKLTRKGDRMTSFDATIQVSGGKFDGRYFGFSDKQEQIEKGKTKYKSYRPELSEKPGPRTNMNIFIDGP